MRKSTQFYGYQQAGEGFATLPSAASGKSFSVVLKNGTCYEVFQSVFPFERPQQLPPRQAIMDPRCFLETQEKKAAEESLSLGSKEAISTQEFLPLSKASFRNASPLSSAETHEWPDLGRVVKLYSLRESRVLAVTANQIALLSLQKKRVVSARSFDKTILGITSLLDESCVVYVEGSLYRVAVGKGANILSEETVCGVDSSPFFESDGSGFLDQLCCHPSQPNVYLLGSFGILTRYHTSVDRREVQSPEQMSVPIFPPVAEQMCLLRSIRRASVALFASNLSPKIFFFSEQAHGSSVASLCLRRVAQLDDRVVALEPLHATIGACAVTKQGIAAMIDVASLSLMASFQVDPEMRGGAVSAAAVSHSNLIVVGQSSGRLSFWDQRQPRVSAHEIEGSSRQIDAVVQITDEQFLCAIDAPQKTGSSTVVYDLRK